MVLVALIAWGAAECRASAITYEYGGVITSPDSSNGITPGTRFSGTFTYDPNDIAQSVENAAGGFYEFGRVYGHPAPASPAIAGMTLSIGGQPIASLEGTLGIGLTEDEKGGYRDASGSISHATYLFIQNTLTNDDPYQMRLTLSNLDHTVYPTLALPPVISLSDFTSATFSAANLMPFNTPNLPSFVGTIDTLTVVPTPEPSTAIVIGVGLAAWLTRLGRRRVRRLHR